MPCRIIQYTTLNDWEPFAEQSAKRETPDPEVEKTVLEILHNVRENGDAALADYTRKFDCPDFSTDLLAVPEADFAHAGTQIPVEDLRILKEAAKNIREFHAAQVRHSYWNTRADGTILGRLIRPVQRVGLYVPGGRGGETPLISSLLMNAIPAVIAGVEQIVVASPPKKDGSLNPYILAAADLLGIKSVYRVGSAWAVAAMVYGTETVPAVDLIAGPGNIFVTTAKRLLIGKIGIDMIAGPSEIAILADSTARPDYIAADMLSQAEHDPLAQALLITDSRPLIDDVAASLKEQLADLPRNEIAARALNDWSALIHVPTLDVGLDLVNRIAPEHLELLTQNPWSLLGKIHNAGAVFVGESTPEPVGDYFAGPNHVLPTMGTARFSSGLSVDNFIKQTTVTAASPEFISANAEKIARLARLEGLEAHAAGVLKRIGK